MKQTGLMLPHKCQTAGWIVIAIPFILVGVLLLSQLFCSESQFTQLVERYAWLPLSSLYLCVPTGGTILCLSKEKEEDEMIRSIRLRAIGIVAIAELLIFLALFSFWGLNTAFSFYTPESGSMIRYLGHFIFCFQFPAYFLLFKGLLYINRKRNEE